MNKHFNIRLIGDDVYGDNERCRPHRHPHFEIAYFTRGNGHLHVDLHRYVIGDGSVFCIPPGSMHCFQCERGIRGFLLSFENPAMRLSVVSPVAGRLDTPTALEWEHVLRMMLRESDNCFRLRTEMLRGLLRVLLVCLERLPVTPQPGRPRSRRTDLTRDFFFWLEKEFLSKRMVADYAGILAVTPNYLNEVIKSVSGFPASHHIQQRVILEAKRLATYSDVPMKQIAYRLNFDDISYFSKFFKQYAGVNFKVFRKSSNYRNFREDLSLDHGGVAQ